MNQISSELLKSSQALIKAQERTILLVEDTAPHAALIQRSLAYDSWAIRHVTRRKSALEDFKNDSNQIVLLDITLPDCDGLELLMELKSLNPDTPIIVVTSLEDVRKSVLAMQRGAWDYVIKEEPMKFAENLKAALNKAFHDRIQRIELQLAQFCRVNQMIKDERLQAMEEVIRTVCSEVNNPLSGLMTFAELVKKKLSKNTLNEEETDLIEKLSQSAEKVAGAVKKLKLSLGD